MSRFANLSIGTKLAITSAAAVMMVLVMAIGQIVGNSWSATARDAASVQKKVAQTAAEAKASGRGMLVGFGDLRLAETSAEIKTAHDYFLARHAALNRFVAQMLDIALNPQNRDNMEKLKSQAEKYAAIEGDVLKLKTQLPPLREKAAAGGPAAEAPNAQAAVINADIRKIAQERAAAAGEAMSGFAEAIMEFSLKRSVDSSADAESITMYGEYLNYLLTAITVLLLAGTAVYSTVAIARPMRRLIQPFDELATGNFAIEVPYMTRGDEIGQIAKSVGGMVERVRGTLNHIKVSALEVTSASAEISTSTTDLSQRTEQQAASLEETSASMEEISATVRKNAENAQHANTSASAALEVADRGGAVVAKAVSAMAEIEQSSRKISDIIGVIDEIARQTNLLALNAAVEAARAGDAGRGFAVVASEVRSLAQRSSQAAKDITGLITNSNGQVKDGVQLVNQAGTALHEILNSIKTVSDFVADIASASAEQATGIDQINRAMTQMDEVTQQNSALVEENAATAKTLEHQAQAMHEQIGFFRVEQGAVASVHGEKVAKVVATAVSKMNAPAAQAAKPMSKPMPKQAGKPMTVGANALKMEPDWTEF